MSTLHRGERLQSTRIAPIVFVAVLLALALMSLFATSDIAGFVLAGGSDWGG